jgi:type VI secretion system secreted protein VgrG
MLEMQDMAGMERVFLSTPHEDTYLHLGAPTNPRHEAELRTRGNALIRADNNLYMKVGKKGKKVFNYEKTVKREGNLTENICQGKYKKTIEDTGDFTETASGDYIMHAKKPAQEGGTPALKIELKNDKMLIDTGGRDFEINCNHFKLNNSNEDNITEGHDFEEHKGTRKEIFHGYSEEEYYGNKSESFVGDKLETHVGKSAEWCLWHKIEGFLGLHESLALSNEFELSVVGKEGIFLGLAFEALLGGSMAINPALQVGWNLATFEKTSFDLEDTDVKFGKRIADMVRDEIRVQDALIQLIG